MAAISAFATATAARHSQEPHLYISPNSYGNFPFPEMPSQMILVSTLSKFKTSSVQPNLKPSLLWSRIQTGIT